MAAKFDKEMMVKQHFWLLLIPMFIGLLLAWIGLSGVADATSEKAEANNTEKKKIDSAKAQPKKVLELLENQKTQLFDLRTQRWKEMWDAQEALFQWPDVLEESFVNNFKDKPFGTVINDRAASDNFRDKFIAAYEKLAGSVSPMQFANSWAAVLRHVPAWKKNPESEDMWLALEDFWVQKELVNALSAVNTEAAKFRPAVEINATDPNRPLKSFNDARHRTFVNRTWEVDLEIVSEAGGTRLAGTIRNRTARLQPYNATNQLVLNVWLSKDPDAKPFQFVIEGTSLEGLKEEKIKPLGKRHQIFEGRVEEIARVEQVLDTRTAPVKRLDRMALGYASMKHNQYELQMSAFSKAIVDKEAEAASSGAAPGPGGVGGPPPMGGLGGGAGASVGGSLGGPPPGAPGIGGSGTQASTTDMTANGLMRRRYVTRTDQVRGMPLGLAVVVDQAYVQDVLTAIANTRLRFQTVQTHLNRFRGNLAYSAGGTVSGGEGPSPMGGPPPMPEGGVSPGFPRGGSAGGPPPGAAGPPPGPAAPGFGEGPSGIPGMGPPGLGGFGSAPRSSNEDQAAGHLVELAIYGIATLYEKFQAEPAKKDGNAVAPMPEPMAPMPEPKGVVPTPMVDPKGGAPMPMVDPKGVPMTDPKGNVPSPKGEAPKQ